jgi:hypothetical protein
LNSNNQTASTKNLNGNFFLTYYVFFSENFWVSTGLAGS